MVAKGAQGYKNRNKDGDASDKFMDAFCAFKDAHFSEEEGETRSIAVAVSGGADSLALCHILSRVHQGKIFALTVDHALRPESADEARYVGEILKSFENVSHHILVWDHDIKPSARIQEQGRIARYKLMADFMREEGICELYAGHHLDDQAETFLFRLAKGSGLDGLACMTPRTEFDNGLFLCRPFLWASKEDLVQYCKQNSLEFVNDPSNQAQHFARVRIRQSMDVLSQEGLTPKRLGVTAYRIGRAREALEMITDTIYNSLVIKDNNRFEFNLKALCSNPEEVVLRVVTRAISEASGGRGYGVRMEKIEALCSDLIKTGAFRKRTLGGIIFEVDPIEGKLILSPEGN